MRSRALTRNLLVLVTSKVEDIPVEIVVVHVACVVLVLVFVKVVLGAFALGVACTVEDAEGDLFLDLAIGYALGLTVELTGEDLDGSVAEDLKVLVNAGGFVIGLGLEPGKLSLEERGVDYAGDLAGSEVVDSGEIGIGGSGEDATSHRSVVWPKIADCGCLAFGDEAHGFSSSPLGFFMVLGSW